MWFLARLARQSLQPENSTEVTPKIHTLSYVCFYSFYTIFIEICSTLEASSPIFFFFFAR